jgi:phosphomannomutase
MMGVYYMISEINKNIFRAYDIRGIYGEDIDPDVFYKIGLSTGEYLKKIIKGSKITVGNDIRQSSQPLVHSLISGLTTTGINVIYTGTTSFGQTLYNGWKQNQDLIGFVTASHLPPEWNGVKFYYGDGVGLPEEELIKIKDICLNEKWNYSNWLNIGQVKTVNPIEPYKSFFKKSFNYSRKLKVAVDCGGASMSLSAPEIFKELGLEITPVYCDPDPTFSQRPSDLKPENLKTLLSAVEKNNCDFGVAFDGDGDRSVIVDNIGEILSADQTGIILGKYGLKDKKGTIIANVECSKAVSEQLTPLGFNVKQIQVGHTFLTLHAKKENSPLGIESSGHLILPSYYLFDDALIIPFKIAEILDQTNKDLASLKSDIPTYPQKKIEIESTDDIKFDVIKKLIEELKVEYDNINTMDGVRIALDTGWVLIRPSNTSPIIRLTAEADSESDVKNIAYTFKNKTEEIIKNFK